MKIAYICADRGIPVDGSKGGSIHVRGVAQALARRGHDLRVLSLRETRPLPGFRPGLLDCGSDALFRQLRHEIRRQGAEALAGEVHSLLLNAGLRRELDRLDASWPVDAVYERLSLWSWAGLHFARERQLPLILEMNAPLSQEQKTWRRLELHPLATALERLVAREADVVIVPSEALKGYLRDAIGRRKPVRVIPNGVDLELFGAGAGAAPEPLAARLRGRFVVAFVGSLKPWHGIESLWRAFRALRRKLPAAHLLAIGDGPMRGFLESAARAAGDEAVTITGALEHHEVPAALSLAHVGVAPYPKLDPFYFCPLKVIEYMAAGLPTVASDLGDIPRLVAHGRTGLLVPPGDSRALTAALRRLADNGPLRMRLGRRARERALRRHGWDAVAERVESLALQARARLRTDAPLRLAAGGAC